MSGVMNAVLAAGAGGAITVSFYPSSLLQATNADSFTTSIVMVIVFGNVGSVTAKWTILTTDGFGDWTINSPDALATNFSVVLDYPKVKSVITARCTVTDSTTSATAFADLSVSYRKKFQGGLQ